MSISGKPAITYNPIQGPTTKYGTFPFPGKENTDKVTPEPGVLDHIVHQAKKAGNAVSGVLGAGTNAMKKAFDGVGVKFAPKASALNIHIVSEKR